MISSRQPRASRRFERADFLVSAVETRTTEEAAASDLPRRRYARAPDHSDDVPYTTTAARAAAAGVVINTRLCGTDEAAARQWREIAHATNGEVLSTEPCGRAEERATTYDEEGHMRRPGPFTALPARRARGGGAADWRARAQPWRRGRARGGHGRERGCARHRGLARKDERRRARRGAPSEYVCAKLDLPEVPHQLVRI